MPEIPNNPVPSLRAFLGQIALSATTAVTSALGLKKLAGGVVQNDIDVRTVVNAAIDAIESLVADGFTALGQVVSKGGFKSVSSDSTKAYAFEAISQARDEDSTTPFTIYSYTPSTTVGGAIDVTARVVAVDEDGTNVYFGTLSAQFRTTGGGVVTQVGTTTTSNESYTLAAMTCSIDTSGGAIRVRMAGRAAEVWHWTVETGITVREIG